jgi:acetyl/propionyl-CoA carboxylase alpha subunit
VNRACCARLILLCIVTDAVRGQCQMRNVIRAERSGTVKSVVASVGETLQADAIMIEFE